MVKLHAILRHACCLWKEGSQSTIAVVLLTKWPVILFSKGWIGSCRGLELQHLSYLLTFLPTSVSSTWFTAPSTPQPGFMQPKPVILCVKFMCHPERTDISSKMSARTSARLDWDRDHDRRWKQKGQYPAVAPARAVTEQQPDGRPPIHVNPTRNWLPSTRWNYSVANDSSLTTEFL